MGSKGSKLAAGAKTVVASNAVKEKTVTEVSKASSETVAAIQRRSARPPVEEELYFDDEMLKEMSQISLVKTPANNMMLNERSLSENTAVIRFHQERRTDQFKKENNRLDVPGRLTEEQLHELLLSYRESPENFSSEAVSAKFSIPDDNVLKNVLKYVAVPRVVKVGKELVGI